MSLQERLKAIPLEDAGRGGNIQGDNFIAFLWDQEECGIKIQDITKCRIFI